MKKTFFICVLVFILFANALPAFAANGAAGDSCTADTDCDGTLACISGKCAVDPNLDTPAPTAGGTNPATPANSAPPAGGVTSSGQSQEFIPLLPALPGIASLETRDSLAPFLSQLYKICIGLAAVLAVLQLMRAGVLYMGGDSITEKKEARDLIGTSIAGLLLVLSPVIIFTIINPKILNLDINTASLKTQISHVNGTDLKGTPGNTAAANLAVGDGSCDVECVAGTTCKNKQCVAVEATGSCSPISSGTTITAEQFGCCNKQPNYNVQTALGTNLQVSYKCVFTNPAPAAITVTDYCQIKPTTGECAPIGPIPTNAAMASAFTSQCTNVKGTVSLSSAGSVGTCPAGTNPDKAYPALAGYVKCGPVRLSCTIK